MTLTEKNDLRWKRLQEVMGAFIAGLETGAAEEEAYEDAAGWRDLGRNLQAAPTSRAFAEETPQ